MYRRILVPLAGSRYSDHALPHAIAIATRTGATIELVHVHHHHERDPDLAALPQYQYQHIHDADLVHDGEALAAAQANLEARANDIELRYGVSVRTRILSGHTADALSREASELVADLIVLATHAREGIERIRFGHMAHELIVHLNVPALCVRPPSESAPLIAPDIRHVLIPLDGSSFSEQILDVTAPLVQALGARATLVHVVGSRPLFATGLELTQRVGFGTRERAVDYLHDLAERFQNRLAEPALTSIQAVDPASSIGQLIVYGGYDLVAMATHGRSGLSRLLLGSVAEKVLRQTNRPVLLYRPRSVRLPTVDLEEAFRITGE
jgi:nucleotide-binding universal stress UspA family protein